MPEAPPWAWPRLILHADMDAFYAAVEVLDDPSLAGQPLLIGGTSGRGVVATASYEARRFGPRSAMSMARGRRLCPQAVIRKPRMSRYAEVSRQVMTVFRSFADQIEPLSLDEAFLDMSEHQAGFESPWAMARALKDEVAQITGGLTVSVGVAPTKFLAKIASELDKPDGITVVPEESALEVLWPLPVRALWGVGPRTAEKLAAAHLHTIADVAQADPDGLSQRFGRLGRHLYRLAWHEDSRPVVSHRTRKSVGWERTLFENVQGMDAVVPIVRSAAEAVAERLARRAFKAYGVRVKLKTAEFQVISRQVRLKTPTDEATRLAEAGLALLPTFEVIARSTPLRLVGLSTYDLVEPGADPRPVQPELF